MIDILLSAPAFAIFETTYDPERAHTYHQRIVQQFYKPGSYATISSGEESGPGVVDSPEVQTVSIAVWVTPEGFARLESIAGADNVMTCTIVTPEEDIQVQQSPQQWMNRQQRRPEPDSRAFEELFGRPYPNEALALLNPFLMMLDYTCVPGSTRRNTCLGHSVTISRYTHNPDFPIDASDDAQRLGSIDVEVMLANDIPLLFGWDALDGDTPFQRTRITRLDLDASFDGQCLFSPESALKRMRADP